MTGGCRLHIRQLHIRNKHAAASSFQCTGSQVNDTTQLTDLLNCLQDVLRGPPCQQLSHHCDFTDHGVDVTQRRIGLSVKSTPKVVERSDS